MELNTLGGKRSIYDKSLFLWQDKNILQGVMVTHVDDFQLCGTETWIMYITSEIKSKFKVSWNQKLLSIGLNVQQFSDHITVDQIKYCSELKAQMFHPHRGKL